MLAKKLFVKAGNVVSVVGRPREVRIELPAGARESAKGPADIVLVFAPKQADVRIGLAEAGHRLANGGALWVAYPKAGKLGTDLSRDVLARTLQAEGLEPVSQIAVDDTWSALRVKRDEALAAARKARGAFAPKAAAKAKTKASAKTAAKPKTKASAKPKVKAKANAKR